MRKIKIILCIVVMAYGSCDSSKIFDTYETLNSVGWQQDFPIEFNYTHQGLIDSCNFLIGLRNNNEFRYANIFFFIYTRFPDGSNQIDTVQYLLAKPNGEWLGQGLGPIKHSLLTFKEQQKMQKGIYTFTVYHGMRDTLLEGIEDIGLRIEKSNS